jgi:leucyl-tRNA synthetase
MNSGFLNGLTVKEALKTAKKYIKEKGIGEVKVNYRLRDAIFSRQRYWGEPFPVYYKDGMPHMLDESKLPLELPEVSDFKPTESGEPPLGHAENWCTPEGYPYELNTMPGFAGSSAYYLRYMDPTNDKALVSKEANQYWKSVDLYVGGTEHATGHLIYSRFWNKFLFDLGIVCEDEPFRKLINQGMIQGRSNFVYRIKDTNTFVSLGLKKDYDVTPIHVDVNIVNNDILDIEAFKAWRPEFETAEFILEDGKYVCGWAVEKMSKSMFNVVNPDDIVDKYGADTLRLYEMFLGPIEQSKPWDTKGIDGVNRFLKKFWGMFFTGDNFDVVKAEPTAEEQKSIHKLIKKVTGDVETFSYNTSIAAFMICANELTSLKCKNAEVLTKFVTVLAPFAPHICEELYHLLGNTGSVCDAQWPSYDEKFLVESSVKYPISFNGKVRFTLELPADMDKADVEKTALANDQTIKLLDGKPTKKVIVVPGKIVNIVF